MPGLAANDRAKSHVGVVIGLRHVKKLHQLAFGVFPVRIDALHDALDGHAVGVVGLLGHGDGAGDLQRAGHMHDVVFDAVLLQVLHRALFQLVQQLVVEPRLDDENPHCLLRSCFHAPGHCAGRPLSQPPDSVRRAT